ncbi:MAG: hypothetical protein JJ953_08350 [Gracilimonas sp.]|uniref:hypothetical protein n=1 Tax=Gracilimonas sp. TaxID=1974203 RepID=UPI001B2C87D7|nr:hypothetical protein [Gracilimonas sp.]MBO6586098.1 hypothetical protein [Gracilimonas sp.]MBO6614755.1 hypothetical protein [Gracilimonas sp.]
MTDFSDIIYLGAAMVVFSLLTMNTSRSFQVTLDTMIRSELEYRAISAAQEEIDAIRWVQARYKSQDPFDSGNSSYYLYEDNPVERTFDYGANNEYSETFTIYREAVPSNDCDLLDSTSQRCYEITITVENNSLDPVITVTQKLIRTLTFTS